MQRARQRLCRARQELSKAEAVGDPDTVGRARERVAESEQSVKSARINTGADQPDPPNHAGLHRAEREAVSARLAAIAANPGIVRKPLTGGVTSRTELVTAPDGTRAVHKTPQPWTEPEEARFYADGEYLAALLGEAVNAPVAPVHRDSPESVWMDYVDGRPAERADLTGGPEEIRMGLLDALTGNGDRLGNLKVRDGKLAGYDHGGTWLHAETGYHEPVIREPEAPIRHFIEPAGESTGRWRDDPPIPAAELAAIRTRVEALRPAFRGAKRSGWLDYSLAALDQIAARAAE